ncbi:hypothetical protein [Sicyoidochytrium minutum DNA virus]|nr:hypothetical protein [Sicyoidochytrium minutum DNA virus]
MSVVEPMYVLRANEFSNK